MLFYTGEFNNFKRKMKLKRQIKIYPLKGLMCTIFGREIGLDANIVQSHVPEMVYIFIKL